jgi:hypothetical protein
MRSLAVVGLLALTLANVLAEEGSTRIVLVNSNIPNGAILKGINEHCHNLILTIDPSKADYELEAQINKESRSGNERSWLTLFNKNGDAVFFTDTQGTGNAVKDVCGFLKLGKP